jgi:hypothetical protein
MAYEGGVDFLELPLGGVDWRNVEIHSPWSQVASDVHHTTNTTGNVELKATARTFDIRNAASREFVIVYDTPRTEGQQLLCIVMGRRIEKGKPEDARHYVLFIAPKSGSARVYERVGVGFMPGNFIHLSSARPPGLVSVR